MSASRSTWATRTREAVARLMLKEGIPISAEYAHDNLDITTWTGIGVVDRRTVSEGRAAFIWLVKQGYAREVKRTEYDVPGGKLYELTDLGASYADRVTREPTPRRRP